MSMFNNASHFGIGDNATFNNVQGDMYHNTHHHHNAPKTVNNIGSVGNAIFGDNYGTIHQGSGGPPRGAAGGYYPPRGPPGPPRYYEPPPHTGPPYPPGGYWNGPRYGPGGPPPPPRQYYGNHGDPPPPPPPQQDRYYYDEPYYRGGYDADEGLGQKQFSQGRPPFHDEQHRGYSEPAGPQRPEQQQYPQRFEDESYPSPPTRKHQTEPYTSQGQGMRPQSPGAQGPGSYSQGGLNAPLASSPRPPSHRTASSIDTNDMFESDLFKSPQALRRQQQQSTQAGARAGVATGLASKPKSRGGPSQASAPKATKHQNARVDTDSSDDEDEPGDWKDDPDVEEITDRMERVTVSVKASTSSSAKAKAKAPAPPRPVPFRKGSRTWYGRKKTPRP